MGKYERYWEMTEGGPYDGGEQVFKCKDCGAVSYPDEGWNGEPDPHRCHPGCRCHETDWSHGRGSRAYKRNFDRIFPNSPGAGI